MDHVEPGPEHKPHIYTVGHSNTPIDGFLHQLKAHGIRLLVDVRRYPSSKRYPQYNRPALAFALQQEGIAYIHEIELGGHREPKADSENGGLKNDGFRAYADHMTSAGFLDAFARICGAARRLPLALMCAEADPEHCHRLYLSDRLTVEGFDVRHILKTSEVRAHRLNADARHVDGRLVYPPDGGQASLF